MLKFRRPASIFALGLIVVVVAVADRGFTFNVIAGAIGFDSVKAGSKSAFNTAPSAPFTNGNLVIYRVGDGGPNPLSNAATPVFLDEYSPTGTLVQSIPLPTITNGANRRLTASGTATSEGFLSRSTDGRYLVLAGYDADPGTASITGSTSASINRVIGRVDAAGIVDTTTALADAISGGNPRGAASTDGSSLWLSGTSSGGGIRYATLGSTSSVAIASTPTNLRVPHIFGGQLYVSAASGAFRLATVGSGVPTTSGQTITNLPGFPTSTGSPYSYFFADLDGASGLDTVYVADDTPGTVQKYSLVSGNWVLNNSVSVTGVRGLTGSVSGTNVTLYATSGTALSTLTDTSGYNANINGTPSSLATAPANTAFRGVAFAPVSGAGGNPGSIQLSSATYSIGEAGVQLTITATRTGGSSGAVGVSYATSNGTATSSGACGSGENDYGAASGTFTWADGDAADKTVNIAICDDSVFEGDENFNFAISSPTGGATLGSPSTAVVTINENDPQPAVVEFDSASYGDDESQTAAVTVTRTGDTSGQSTVSYTTSAGSATAGAACGLNIDFVSASGTITFAAGETLKVFNVQLCPDPFRETPAETFTVNLSNPGGPNTVLGGNTTATVSINDTASEFRNRTAIVVPDGGTPNAYPSTMTVGGAAGPIAGLRVTLYGMTASNAADIDVLLVGPQGQQILLMADAGGAGAFPGPRTLTFSDAAGQVLPSAGAFGTGEYEPTSWESGQGDFPTPAPAGPYNEPGNSVGGTPSLASVFGGTDPNGEWKLFIRDDNGSAPTATEGAVAASIPGGWGIEFTTQPGQPVNVAGRAFVNGRAVYRVYIHISGGNLPQPRVTVTNSFGYYVFRGLEAGQTYNYQVISQKYDFSPPSGTFTLSGNMNDANLIGTRR